MNLFESMISFNEQQSEDAFIDTQTEEEARTDTIDEMFSLMDDSGFAMSEACGIGIDKLPRPSEYGFDAGRTAAKAFATASDPQDTDIDLIFDKAFSDDSGFETNNAGIPNEDIVVDANTVPAVPSEDDQFTDMDAEEDAEDFHVSDTDLAFDEDEKDIETLGESAFDWDDLL